MRSLTLQELELVSGGGGDSCDPCACYCPCPPDDGKKEKGNNGWGNGAEGINNGSDEGATQNTKLPENDLADPHKIHDFR